MTLIFDTSALSRILSGNDYAVRRFSEQVYDNLAIPLATDAELRFGFANGNREAENLNTYKLFKQQFGIHVVNPDQDMSVIYATLATYAKENGLALSNNDFWIAATTIKLGGVLFTSDNDFKSLPQLRTVTIDS